MNQADHSHWDHLAATAIMGGDEAAAEQLFDMLVNSLAVIQHEMPRQLQQNDYQSIAETAHKIKGSSRLCCTRTLETLMQQIETAAKAAQADVLAQHLSEFDHLADRLRAIRNHQHG
jgi:HPt (histidine-containing phosphotransfer) domain-containing protein